MTKSMTRGKQQILLNHLPGKTFDFQSGPISRVASIRGFPRNDLNETVVLQRVAKQARAWPAQLRPALSDRILDSVDKFVLIDPVGVEAELFPKVFSCQNANCGYVVDYSNREGVPQTNRCPSCSEGKLVQLRFVKIHRCGAIDALAPPACPQCHRRKIALSTRGSERISGFRWICLGCGHAFGLFGGPCRHCEWPNDPNNAQIRNMDIEVHRAGRTYFPQSAVLLNIPHQELAGLFNRPQWEMVVAAKYLELSAVRDRPLSSYGSSGTGAGGINLGDLDAIFAQGLSNEEILKRVEEARRSREASAQQPDTIAQMVVAGSGVPAAVWQRAGSDLLEALNPFETTNPRYIARASSVPVHQTLLGRLGLKEVSLVQDYTIINATFGFSRVEYANNQCWLNPFPPDERYQGRLPIFVDKTQADALLISLDPARVLRWLAANGIRPTMPAGNDPALVEQGYFVQLFDEIDLYHTFTTAEAERRMVFGLLHTFAHACVKQASLLCGLERTSLSEYLLPKTLTIALYCNHRFGATIGALTALFEQTFAQWLDGVRDSQSCVYDPQCFDHGANCHACTHLSETSCRFFNLNLSRSFLFGGPELPIGRVGQGYFGTP